LLLLVLADALLAALALVILHRIICGKLCNMLLLLWLQAIPLLKESIKKAYGKKGEKIVAQNCAAVDSAVAALKKINIPAAWADAVDAPEGRLGAAHTPVAQAAAQKGVAHFLEEVVKPILAMEGDRLPVR
jgi:pyruvate-ferredoxin/flavodoxin oxidoreductase